MKFDKPISEATSLRISETDNDAIEVAALLATFDDSTTTAARGILLLRKAGSPDDFAAFKITGALVDKGTWDTLPIAVLATAGAIANGDAVTLEFYRTGDKGDAGVAGEKGEKGDAGATGAEGRWAALHYKIGRAHV